jgi:hypothetical protein
LTFHWLNPFLGAPDEGKRPAGQMFKGKESKLQHRFFKLLTDQSKDHLKDKKIKDEDVQTSCNDKKMDEIILVKCSFITLEISSPSLSTSSLLLPSGRDVTSDSISFSLIACQYSWNNLWELSPGPSFFHLKDVRKIF